jgi:hypothetical protein
MEKLKRKGLKRLFSLFKPNLLNMNVHSATCSCSVEPYKLWYTLADFLPNWNFRGVFSSFVLPFIFVPPLPSVKNKKRITKRKDQKTIKKD